MGSVLSKCEDFLKIELKCLDENSFQNFSDLLPYALLVDPEQILTAHDCSKLAFASLFFICDRLRG